MVEDIVFATQKDESELQAMFLAYGMYTAGDITDHVMIKDHDRIIAGAMLTQTKINEFHLSVFAVNQAEKQRGIGGTLLKKLLEKPWCYCKNSTMRENSSYRITTQSRGTAVTFYQKWGFAKCEFQSLAKPFDQQCNECPDEAMCQPVALQFLSKIPT